MVAALLVALLALAGFLLLAPPRLRGLGREGTGTGRMARPLRPSNGPGNGAADRLPDAALMLDLLGAMFRAGTSLPVAVRTLARVAEGESSLRLEKVAAALQLGTEWSSAWALAGDDENLAGIREALKFGAATGAPSADILHAQAEQLRRRRKQEAERRAAALGTKLVLPLGLCALPSFVCLGIVPVLISLLPQL
ncbi:bacterial type II secretion system protein F domain protein [Arthrobacter crystallopoietes BAB-32]|uniref:Bacterial type II secretion system protein F domain protein n=1 Tax=Arthrobacter crystallopoietes BAB-32 TaxID=1246476 RepID=N1UZM3_9MICC|nr:type II secretion system F family protein [Arthrobacter crystallopoietes]EMY34520.1 bacterial type II secretion system protein F domain protein [Arthrobacter crystallopoietes BAB-32]